MRKIVALVFCFNVVVGFSQIASNTHALLDSSGELSFQVKEIISSNVKGKQFVFLGESFHQSGADMTYKTQMVKYLYEELDFDYIVFESDFFAFFFSNDPKNIYWTWYGAQQCIDLFEFIKQNDIGIKGLDPKLHSTFSKNNFISELTRDLERLSIPFSEEFIITASELINIQFKARDSVQEDRLERFFTELDQVVSAIDKDEEFLLQALKNLKSSAIIYTAEDDSIGIAERDRQMADNLDYLAKTWPDKKFIVWAANSHIAKTDSEYMGEATMGCEFLKLNPDNSYHIAFASIMMPYRSMKKLEKQARSEKDLLHYLPSLESDYFIDAKQAVIEDSSLSDQEFMARLWSAPRKHLKTTWLAHFDAIVYIAEGELTTFKN